MNAFRPLSKQPWVVAGKQQRNRLGQAHTLSSGVGLYSFSDTIPVRLNRLLKCPLAVACVCPAPQPLGGSAEPVVNGGDKSDMKGCGDYRGNIRRFLDQELCPHELDQFRAHLAECAACRQELEAEEELSCLLARSRPLYSAPDSLRNRVLRAMREPLPQSLPDPRPKPSRG
jgi:mycothiol system anti-sigma-R factor